MHVSLSQLLEMRDGPEPYDIYRIYAIDERTARLRIAANVQDYVNMIIKPLEALPAGITVDGVSIKPDTIAFGQEYEIELPAAGQSDDE